MSEKNTVNKIILVGELASQLSIENVANERWTCFTLSTIEHFKGEGGRIHKELHYIRVPERIMEQDHIALSKMICIQGRIQTKIFVDELGIKRYQAEIIAHSIDTVALQA